MYTEQAAIVATIVPANDPEDFWTTAGEYFFKMEAKAKVGEHNLGRTLWATRRTAQPEFRREWGMGGARP